jgi:hypothetical protein
MNDVHPCQNYHPWICSSISKSMLQVVILNSWISHPPIFVLYWCEGSKLTFCVKKDSFSNLNTSFHRVINKSVSLHSRCIFPTNRGFHQKSKLRTIFRNFSLFKLFYFIAWKHDHVTNKKLLNQATYILSNQFYFQRKVIYSQWFPNA